MLLRMQVPAHDPATAPAGLTPGHGPTSTPRWPALLVFLGCSAVLVTAWSLTPNTQDGLGTHKALGLRACGLVESAGIPCATCGMTTSFSLMAHGRFLDAFINQPAGALLTLLTAMTAAVSGYALVTGMSLGPVFSPFWRPRVMILAGVALVLSWVYKILTYTGWIGAGI